MAHIPVRLFNSAGLIPDPTSNADPIANYWFQNIQHNFAWTGSVFPAPDPIAIARALPHPTTVQQISKFQGEPPY